MQSLGIASLDCKHLCVPLVIRLKHRIEHPPKKRYLLGSVVRCRLDDRVGSQVHERPDLGAVVLVVDRLDAQIEARELVVNVQEHDADFGFGEAGGQEWGVAYSA